MVSRQKCEPMEDLTVGQIVAIHDKTLADPKGDCRVLSEANLHQLVFRANLIPECVPRAAFVFYSLCAYPAFLEGNSGTALAVTEQVLSTGGYRIPEKKTGLLALAEGILAFTTEPEEIERWLRDNVLGSISR
jgi:prophage maintenance system killer protein